MKLAEALLKRAELKKTVEELKSRAEENASVQEGEEPFEDPEEMLNKAIEVNDALTALVKRINITNQETITECEKSLSDLLAERDAILRKRSIVKSVIEGARIEGRTFRFTRAEIKKVVVIDIKKMQALFDEISHDYRRLDTLIQGINWQTDLIS